MISTPRHNPLSLSIRVDNHSQPSGLRSRTVSPLPSARRTLLADTPVSSPAVITPSLQRYSRKSSVRASQRLRQVALWFLGTLIILYGAIKVLSSGRSPAAVNYQSTDGKAYEIVGEDSLPDYATALVVTDQRGRQKWTVSIPSDSGFPLKPSEYHQICSQSREVSQHVEDLKMGNTEHKHAAHHGYYHHDPFYMDIGDAQTHGLLPGGPATSKKHDIWAEMVGSDAAIEAIAPGETDKVCETSLTYVMESEDAGLGATLVGLWLSYGLAQKEDRAFFIDDTNWAYGSYETYFKPAPKPSCLPPPKVQITPCPHQARHLLVSAATTPFTFGGAFTDYFEDARKMRVYRQEPIFSMIRQGYEALFDLASADGEYVSSRIDELNTTVHGAGGIQVGIHVRHGDRHPLEFQYQKSYLPLTKYINAARMALYATFTDASTGVENFHGEMSSKLLLATDDPDVYFDSEMSQASRAQERISLASKSSASKTETISGVDNRVGWEGGFFRDVFWSLGLPSHAARKIPEDSPPPSFHASSLPSPRAEAGVVDKHEHAIHPSSEALHLRELVGRAYLIDLAILGQSDAVVCGVSSIACRILAVMMGWENAIERGMWRNVDGDFEWWGMDW